MKGDFSRFIFDAGKHYAGVLHQQGRVWLDSDWNEDVAERLALLRTELRDVIGPCGVPTSSSFQLSASADARPENFRIAGGHAYVNGILCAIDGDTSYLTQPDLPDPDVIRVPTDGSTLTALIYLEVWHRLITHLEDDSIRETALGGPDTSARLKTITQVKAVTIPNGTAKCSDASQFLPQPGSGRLTTLQPAPAAVANACRLPDPANYTGRENRLYRVEVHDGGDVFGAPSNSAVRVPLAVNVAAGATSLTAATALTAAQVSVATRAGFVTVADSSGNSERLPLASIDPGGSVLKLGQPLANAYTTANRASISTGIARFKWSRDNASFAVGVTNVKADRLTITLAGIGRDAATALRQGDLVELCDDSSELGPARGHLTVLRTDPDPDTLIVQLADALPVSLKLDGETSSRHLILRRWDGIGDAAATFDPAGTPGMDLGDGVHIQFSGSDLRPGDYWQFTTRAADGTVQALNNAEPNGIQRSRCALGIVTWGPPPPTTPPAAPGTIAFTVVQDCRKVFPALVDFPRSENGFHVTQVLSVDSSNRQTALANDTDIQVNLFGGLDVVCDQAPDPDSVVRPSCYIATEVPVIFDGGAEPALYTSAFLAGKLSVDAARATISWRVGRDTQRALTELIASSPNERGILAKLVLKGRHIWALNNPNLFLDGEAFGAKQRGTNNVALTLPSGDARRGGDFEFWFWIVAAPSSSRDVSIVPPEIHIGEDATVTVTLTSSAPAGSPPAIVASSAPAVATVPSNVAAAQGATTLTFKATGKQAGSTTLTVTFGAPAVPPSATLTVIALPQLTGPISIAPPSILIGNVAKGTISLTGPAPLNGAKVTLTSSNAGVAAVQTDVTIAAGASNITFDIRGAAAGTATISAKLAWPTGDTSTASGNVTIRAKGKEGKEVKEGKEFRKETQKELSKELESKHLATEVSKLREASPSFPAVPAILSPMPQGTIRAFILPVERPPVIDRVMEESGLETN